MSVVVPTVLFVIFLIGIGATVGNYVGQTPYEAIETVKNNHDYSCSESYFDEMYDAFRQVGYANKPITIDDINKALGMGEDLYNGACEYAGSFIEFFLGNFDDQWVADVSSRSIRVYDNDGNLVGSTEIVGTSDTAIGYDEHVTVMPQLIDGGTLLFRTISADGTFYHNYITYIADGNTTVYGADFIYVPWMGDGLGYVDKYASNVAFIPSIYRENAVQIKAVYNGNTGISSASYISPISGASSDLDSTIPYIGVADTPDGEAGVRPDGSVVLPDGTVVYPNQNDGTYPFPVTMDPDWWAKLAASIAGDNVGEDSPTDAGTINLNLEGLRSLVSSIYDYMKNGFWADLKENLLSLFNVDTSKFNFQQLEQYNIVNRFLQWADALFYGLTGTHLVTQGG